MTLTVARVPEWETTWSQSGSGRFDSEDIGVTAAEGKWRIVVDLRPRYLIFGSGSATLAWEGAGAGQIGLDSVGIRRGRPAQRRRHVPDPRAPARKRQLDRARRAVRVAQRRRLRSRHETDLRLLRCVGRP